MSSYLNLNFTNKAGYFSTTADGTDAMVALDSAIADSQKGSGE